MVVKIMLVFLFWNLSEEGNIGIEREWETGYRMICIWINRYYIINKDGRRLFREYIAG